MNSEKIITVSIIGVGSRGGEAYGRYINELKDKYKIVALCDEREDRLYKYGQSFNVPNENRFSSDDEFFKEKRSDLLIVATLDTDHVRTAKRALKVGYDILLEKPISTDPQELKELKEEADKAGRRVIVCHVLRYTVMIHKVKELLDAGKIGRLISMEDTENVVFWHEAHSFVRGNWRNTEVAAPMIMAKCCHDLDLLQFFAKSKCKSVSSMGSLAYFKKENQPEGAAERCTDCKYRDSCVYSAKRIYIEMWKNMGSPANIIPMNVVTEANPITEEALEEAIKTGEYGRCAFCCDNNVVDNQAVLMRFENGVTAALKMEAFTADGGRDMRFYGTEGELEVREKDDLIVLKRYFESPVEWKISELKDENGGMGTGHHGGGDHRMIDRLYKVFSSDEKDEETALDKSLESHYMAIAAEKSRLSGGKLVELCEYRK